MCVSCFAYHCLSVYTSHLILQINALFIIVFFRRTMIHVTRRTLQHKDPFHTPSLISGRLVIYRKIKCNVFQNVAYFCQLIMLIKKPNKCLPPSCWYWRDPEKKSNCVNNIYKCIRINEWNKP